MCTHAYTYVRIQMTCYKGGHADAPQTMLQVMFADALKSRLMAEERALEGGTRGYQLLRAATLAADVVPPLYIELICI